MLPKRYNAAAAIQALARRHAAMLALSIALLGIGWESLDCFLKSDDYKWVFATVADAGRPWRVFSPEARLFGSYYRPVAHVVWMLNYYVWGFEFRGHQAGLILMWFASAWLVYSIGLLLWGRLAGFIAAACVGLNQIYIQTVSWKAWYTTLTEYFLVLACIRVYLGALPRRSGRGLAAAGALGLLAVLSRELAPLVLSAVVFTTLVEPPIRSDRWTWRRAGWVALWGALSIAVLLALPSYRQAARAVVVGPLRMPARSPAEAAPAPRAETSFSLQHVEKDLPAHLEALYRAGVFPGVVLFVTVAEYLRLRHSEEKMGARHHYVLVGAVLVLSVGAKAIYLFARGCLYLAGLLSGRDVQPIPYPLHLLEWVCLTLLFLWVAARGRKHQRMLAAWFVVSFVPILFLEHHSGAYQMLAFTAVALYVGMALAREAQTAFVPALQVVLRRAPEPRDWTPRAVHAALLAGVLAAVPWMLTRNVILALPVVRDRAARGVEDSRAVTSSVSAAAAAFRSRRAFVLDDDLARLSGLILHKRHGFSVAQAGAGAVVPFRAVDLPLPVYESAQPYESVRSRNLVPNGGFESPAPGLTVASPGYRSPRSMALRLPAGIREDVQEIDLRLPPPPPGYYAFGAVARTDDPANVIEVRLVLETPGGRRVFQGHEQRIDMGWLEVMDCARLAPEARSLDLRIALRRGRGRESAMALVDDVFLIPVGPP